MSTKENENQPQEGEMAPPTRKDQTDIIYPSGLKFGLLMMSIFVGMFLVSLDRLIISTAIPQITDEFKSAGDIGWYGTTYLLTSCAFQLVFGKLYKIFSVKVTFLTSILLFEVGSALCGAAPNSIAFILGRSIAGLGSGGVLTGVFVVIVHAVPLQKRPKYQGLFGAVFGISSVLGPTIGGAFTTNVTWRWCFYINLPLGAVVMVLIFFLLQAPNRPKTEATFRDKLRQLNILGLIALVPGIVCLCLALQWGGTVYAWSEGRVIAVLVLAFVLLIAFALIQVWKPEQATVPPRIFIQRSIASGFWVSCCLGAHQTIFLYYLPIWFQAIDGDSAMKSGIDLLAMVLPIVLASVIAGLLTSRIGYYTPFLILGVCLSAVGAGLLTTVEVGISKGKHPIWPREDVAIGGSLMFFGQLLFGAVFTSVGENVLDKQLANRLTGIPGISPQLIQKTGATELLNHTNNHATALVAYNDSLRACFQVGLIMACLAIIGALGMEWRTVKKKSPPKEADGTRATAEDKANGDLSEREAPEAKAEV